MKFLSSLIVVLLIAGNVTAQNGFSEVKVGLTGHNFFKSTTIGNSWDPSKGLGLLISSPYYFGSFETGVRYVRYNELQFEDSGFHSTFVFVGWNYPFWVSEDLYLAPGFRVGTNFLTQDQEIFYDDLRFQSNESEFSIEFTGRLNKKITNNLHLHIGVSYNRTLLEIPFTVWYGNAGIAYSFGTPGWLKTFLK